MTNRTKRILHIRPGLLANFSGGYGYMPFIFFLSAPLSFLGTLFSNLLVYRAAGRMMRSQEHGEFVGQRVDVAQFLNYARVHLIVCAVLSVIAGGFLLWAGISLLYSHSLFWILATIFLAAGPFGALYLSTRYLVSTICEKGVKARYLLCAILVYLGLMVLCVLGFVFMSAFDF